MKLLNAYNCITGGLILIFSAILGEFWYLFAIFLLFNIIDWLTGWYKARKLKEESSAVGLKGLVKKIGYWVMLLVAFTVPVGFIPLGRLIQEDLSFLTVLGWFALASLMINEVRSILENLVEVGYHVPEVLIKGLAVTEDLVHSKEESAKR